MIDAATAPRAPTTDDLQEYVGTATYSPEDNKLRLYPFARLDPPTYERVKEAGFAWAPRQNLFVAGMWTPGREDLLIELCGEIGDEDTGLAARAEQRADRFDGYSDSRTRDAHQATEAVKRIADGIPFGQPILVGHHSERRARKDAERIEAGMRRAVRLWDTADYWEQRAAGAIANAKYKERPDVRARRIKTIEADQRKAQRTIDDAERFLKAWGRDGLTFEQGKAIANVSHISRSFPLSTFPRALPASQYEGPMSIWSALDGGVITLDQARRIELAAHERAIARASRWVQHCANRLVYERAMLGEQGGTIADRTTPEKGGAIQRGIDYGKWRYVQRVNRVSVSVLYNYGNGGRNFVETVPFDKLAGVMTAAPVKAAREAGRLQELADGTGFLLLPSPQNDDTNESATVREGAQDTAPVAEDSAPAATAPADAGPALAESVEAMRASLRAGVQTVSAPQLFPTPAAIATLMVEALRPAAGCRLLEPSAGTGRLLRALPGVLPFGASRQSWCGDVVAVERSAGLCKALNAEGIAHRVVCGDFLECEPETLGQFEAVVMNPPFENAIDVRHIQHAARFLTPGGRLVALCAAGPRQVSVLKAWAEASGGSWETLPDGSFLTEGTNVRAAMLVFNSAAESDFRSERSGS